MPGRIQRLALGSGADGCRGRQSPPREQAEAPEWGHHPGPPEPGQGKDIQTSREQDCPYDEQPPRSLPAHARPAFGSHADHEKAQRVHQFVTHARLVYRKQIGADARLEGVGSECACSHTDCGGGGP